MSATESLRTSDKLTVTPWPNVSNFGAALADEVRKEILKNDVLVCDITTPNLNVYYEIGFAIGSGMTIAPVINVSFADAVRYVLADGFFDGIGFKKYENSEQLAQLLLDLPSHELLQLYGKSQVNPRQPLFILDTFRKTDFRNTIVSAVKSSGVFFRSFDPVEVPRFSTVQIIGEATSSAGIVVPLLAAHIDDSFEHNLRAAFLAGLGHGLHRDTLLIQREHEAVPIDYRDFVISVQNEGDLNEKVGEFAKNSLIAAQSIGIGQRDRARTPLQQLTLGASSAENEFRTLENYFVETAEYVRTIRGETRIVAGRKGSGKTAIFFRVRDRFREDRRSFVVDLKPESHQLSLFREELLKIADAGIFDHTLAAFWYFVIITEVLESIRRRYELRAKYDYNALAVTTEIDAALGEFEIFGTGDFTSRINRLGSIVVNEIKSLTAKNEKLTPERLTNVVFKGGIQRIRNLIDKYTSRDTPVILLFDNIDKGWLAQGVHEFDVRLVRLLIESLEKVRRDFSSENRDFMSVLFLRNDIHELLVEQTPDRGKAGQVRIDWTDRAKLRQVIYRRLVASTGVDRPFEELWTQFFAAKVKDLSSFEYFIDHCLMRPRFLINIIENAISNGINRGHNAVSEEDCIDAVRQHSLYLMSDFGYEIRDVSGISAEILYSLVGTTKLLTHDEVTGKFEEFGIDKDMIEAAFLLMLWYGILGVALENGEEHFIYDYDYDMKRLQAEIRLSGRDTLYVTNAALHVALRL
jgi:hypothetical protein